MYLGFVSMITSGAGSSAAEARAASVFSSYTKERLLKPEARKAISFIYHALFSRTVVGLLLEMS